jgi:bacterioferritin
VIVCLCRGVSGRDIRRVVGAGAKTVEAIAAACGAGSMGEMKHADALIQRILRLEGVPNLQRLGKINVGQTVPEQLRLDLDVERAAITALNTAIELCRSLGDNGSRDLLESILRAEEEHVNWIEAQLTLIAQAGEANDLAQQIREAE